VIGAVLEQRVWVWTTSPLYPNLYIMLVGHPGTGKTRTVRLAKTLVSTLPEFHLAPISMTWASLVDTLIASKKFIIDPPREPVEYNSMYIAADEIGTFIHKYDPEMTDGLSAMYDPDPYSQVRRTKDLKIRINSPQLSMVVGATPQRLMSLLPEDAWGQGFMSRVIMVFSDERIVGDDFDPKAQIKTDDLEHDLLSISTLMGQFHVTQDYRDCINLWRGMGESPAPGHPKLTHYNSRRKTTVYKLSMISAVDKSDGLVLTREDFNQAMSWLHEAENWMPEVFKAGSVNSDGQAMEEITHYLMIADKGKGITEGQIIRYARDRVPLHSIVRVIEVLERSGQIFCIGVDSVTGIRRYSVRREQLQ
jgi:hypothetical protein